MKIVFITFGYSGLYAEFVKGTFTSEWNMRDSSGS